MPTFVKSELRIPPAMTKMWMRKTCTSHLLPLISFANTRIGTAECIAPSRADSRTHMSRRHDVRPVAKQTWTARLSTLLSYPHNSLVRDRQPPKPYNAPPAHLPRSPSARKLRKRKQLQRPRHLRHRRQRLPKRPPLTRKLSLRRLASQPPTRCRSRATPSNPPLVCLPRNKEGPTMLLQMLNTSY